MTKNILFVLLILLSFATLGAQDETAGAQDETAGSQDFDADFFADTEVINEDAVATDTFDELFLATQPVKIGGNFTFELSTGVKYFKDYDQWNSDYLFTEATENSFLTLDGSLYFSARPSADNRYFGKFKIAYPFFKSASSLDDVYAATDSNPQTIPGTGIPIPNLKIWELFTDFDIDKTVYFRVGKQLVGWGVGYFFQPSDVVSLTAVDPNDPTAEREGPLAVKASLPFDSNVLELYLLVPAIGELTTIKDTGLAARLSFVLGDFEFGLGTTYQQTSDIKFVTTIKGSLWRFEVFAEALVNRTSLGSVLLPYAQADYFDPDGPGPSGQITHEVVSDRSDWFFSGSLGLRFSDTNSAFMGIAQYYFNGEGYADARTVADDIPFYLATGNLSIGDIAKNTGQHYLAALLSWGFVKDSDVTLSAFWIGNLSDGSGYIKPNLKIKFTDEISVDLGTTFNYGEDKSQFRGISAIPGFAIAVAGLDISVSLGTGSF